jgi:hypothetical protein
VIGAPAWSKNVVAYVCHRRGCEWRYTPSFTPSENNTLIERLILETKTRVEGIAALDALRKQLLSGGRENVF